MNEPYFLQTKEWSEFWVDAAGKGHEMEFVTVSQKSLTVSGYCYLYPWHLNQTFLYIPKGPFVSGEVKDNRALLLGFRCFIEKVIEYAKKKEITFVKLELDDYWLEKLSIEGSKDIVEFVSNSVLPNGKDNMSDIDVVVAEKKIQYLSTMTLDLTKLTQKYDGDDLSGFYLENKDFWAGVNQNVRRYTKKSLKKDWVIDFQKNEKNFEDFWFVYSDTAKRQKFATHNKEYFKKLFDKDFSKVIVLRDKDNKPHCVWFGVILGDTIYYLYGGNTQYSFDNYGQYLIHVIAIGIASQSSIKYYDLGGYDSGKGFGKFKDGYRGIVREFGSPVDIVLQKRKYIFTSRFVNTAKTVRNAIPFI